MRLHRLGVVIKTGAQLVCPTSFWFGKRFTALNFLCTGGFVKELVIVRGKNFRDDLKLKWRVCGSMEPLKECELMPTKALEELGILYLTSSPVSLALVNARLYCTHIREELVPACGVTKRFRLYCVTFCYLFLCSLPKEFLIRASSSNFNQGAGLAALFSIEVQLPHSSTG